MKKVLILFVALAAFGFTACQQELVLQNHVDNESTTLVFTSEKPIFDGEAATRTEWTGSTIRWSENDQIRIGYTVDGVWQGQNDQNTTPKLYASDRLAAAAETASFTLNNSFASTATGTHIFYSLYPGSIVSSTDFHSAPLAAITIPSEQTPEANSFDSKADLMIGKSESYNEKPTTEIPLSWARLAAHAELTINNLTINGGETIVGITFTAQDDARLVGMYDLNLVTGVVSNPRGVTNVISVDASNLTYSENSIKVWVSMLPVTITELTVTVETDKAYYERSFNSISRQFLNNKHNTMRIGMSTVTRTPKPENLVAYEESFNNTLGSFSIEREELSGSLTYVWIKNSGYAKASAYKSGNNYAATSYLVSPELKIGSNNSTLTFEHAANYLSGNPFDNYFKVVVFDGASEDILTLDVKPDGASWTFVKSTVSLSAYNGKTIQIGFKYTSTNSVAGTWEVRNFKVTDVKVALDPELSYTVTSFNANLGDSFVAPTLNNPHDVAVTYSSSNTSVATVNETTGAVELGSTVGSTTITASFAGNEDYLAGSASYTINLVDPSINYSDFSWDLSTNQTTSASTSSLNWYYRGFTMVAAKASSTTDANNYCPPTRTSTRFYTNSTLTITPYSGCTIGYVEFEATSESYANVLNNSSWSNASAAVAGTTVTVTPVDGTSAFSATIGGACGFTNVTVYYTGSLEPLANYTVTFSQPIETGCSFTVSVDDVDITSGDAVVTGKVVKLTPTAGSGYVFTSWTVTDAGSNSVTVTNNQFTMPSSNVTISATFTETGGDPTEKEYYKLNTTSTPVGTNNAYDAYKDIACANNLASYGTYPSTATWSTTCGSKQSNTSFWWGANNKQSAKMILSNGSVNGASGIATALGITTSATYYSALICSTNFANISKVVMTRSTPGGTAPSKIYLLKSTDDGSTWTKIGEENDAATVTFVVSTPYAASARYALVIYSTGYCQYKDPIITFYTTD